MSAPLFLYTFFFADYQIEAHIFLLSCPRVQHLFHSFCYFFFFCAVFHLILIFLSTHVVQTCRFVAANFSNCFKGFFYFISKGGSTCSECPLHSIEFSVSRKYMRFWWSTCVCDMNFKLLLFYYSFCFIKHFVVRFTNFKTLNISHFNRKKKRE